MSTMTGRPVLARLASLAARPAALDLAAAAIVLAASLSEMHAAAPTAGLPYRATDPAAIALAAAACAALAVQRFAAGAAVLVTGLVTVTLSAAGYVSETPVHGLGLSGPSLGPVFGLYALALRHGRARSVPVLLCAAVGGVVAQAAFVRGSVAEMLPGTVAALVVAWALGDARRARRAYVESVAARAERLDRERHMLAEAAVARERARIARELHDVVAHHVSLMIVTAAAADRQVSRDPGTARRILRDLITTGQSAVTEMRRMLGVLRSDERDADNPGGTDGGRLQPQPTLADLDALIATFTGAGLAVRLTGTGPRGPLPVGVELTAYRILQESLTNVLKHKGPGACVQVTVDHGRDALSLEVRDHGGAPVGAPGSQGHGLVGMRERADLLGGRLDAGPLPGGGFRVRAWLPTGPARTAPSTAERRTA